MIQLMRKMILEKYFFNGLKYFQNTLHDGFFAFYMNC